MDVFQESFKVALMGTESPTFPTGFPRHPCFSEGKKKREREGERKENIFGSFKQIAAGEGEDQYVQIEFKTWYSVQNCSILSFSNLQSSRHVLRGSRTSHQPSASPGSAVSQGSNGVAAGRCWYLMAATSALCFAASRMHIAAAAWQCFNTAGSISCRSGSSTTNAPLRRATPSPQTSPGVGDRLGAEVGTKGKGRRGRDGGCYGPRGASRRCS